MRNGPDFAVTVVIPLYNKARFIRATLESVIAQTLPAAEIIVVNDQSTDEGPDLVRTMAHPRIRMIDQPNAGPGPARNRGVSEARTPWVAFLDGDDLWLLRHLEALARLSRAFPAAHALATTFERCTAGALGPVSASQAPPIDRLIDYFREPLSREVLWTSCVAMRCDAFVSSGGFGAFQSGEDQDLWARFALDHAIAVTSELTAIYLQDTGGIMDSLQLNRQMGYHFAPIFQTLDHALANPRYSSIHAAINVYKAALIERSMRQALYRGEARTAQLYCAALRRVPAKVPLTLHILSYLPGPMLRFGIALRSRMRRSRH